MRHYFGKIDYRLKKATINDRNCLFIKHEKTIEKKSSLVQVKSCEYVTQKNLLFFTVQKILFKFLFIYSKFLFDKNLKKKTFLIFIKIFNYLKFFSFNNKNFFFKNYFLKETKEIIQLNNFFFSIKFISLKKSLSRLKKRKKTFYKKNIWVKKRRFRKKTILIFDKLFSKKYTFDRFNSFIVDSLLLSLNCNKWGKKTRLLKKGLFDLLRRKFYYLFLHKKFIRNKRKWYRKPFLLNLYYFDTKGKIPFNFRKKKFVKRRRKYWRQVYHTKKNTKLLTLLFFSFNSKSVDFSRKFFFKKKFFETNRILNDYLFNYGLFLSKTKKYSKDKNFLKRFVSKRTSRRRYKNIFYFFKRKRKIFYLNSFNFLKEQRKFKGFLFNLLLYKLFARKTKWKNKKLQRKFLIFYLKYFLNNKFLPFFNIQVKYNLFFSMFKRRKRLFRLKRRRFTLYDKRRRKRFLKRKIKKKVLRFFLILLLIKFMRKNVNPEKNLILCYSFFYQHIKKINMFFTNSIYFGHQDFYFNVGPSFNSSISSLNVNDDLKLISLIKKK